MVLVFMGASITSQVLPVNCYPHLGTSGRTVTFLRLDRVPFDTLDEVTREVVFDADQSA